MKRLPIALSIALAGCGQPDNGPPDAHPQATVTVVSRNPSVYRIDYEGRTYLTRYSGGIVLHEPNLYHPSANVEVDRDGRVVGVRPATGDITSTELERRNIHTKNEAAP